MKRILMLHTNGYFEKSIYITFYYKQGEFLNKTTSVEILRLFKTDYKISSRCLGDIQFHENFFVKGGIVTFLTKFYDCIKSGRSVSGLIPDLKHSGSKDDKLDHKIKRFENRAQLMAYGEKLMKSGYPIGAVLNFVLKYSSLHFDE